MEKAVFITEVGVPAPGPPGPVVPEPFKVTDERRMVRNIYDFPSVQNLKVENGANMPFRYKMKPPGRAPIFRMAQGKRLTKQSSKMTRHQMIFNTGIGERAVGMGGMPEEARRERSCMLPVVREGRGGGSVVESAVASERQPSLVPSSSPRKVVREKLSKQCVAGIESRSGIEVPRAPTPSAPPPIPSTPITSSIASNPSIYDNLTSVSLRTPQTSTCSSKLQSGLNRLTQDLLQEEAYKREVQKELQSLKQRQDAIIAALSRDERAELERQLTGSNA